MTALIRQFTVDEYHRLAELGVLHSDERVELLNGQIITMLPIGPFHGGSVKRLVNAFERLSRDRWITSVQDPVRLDEHDEPQPDLMLLRPDPNFYTERHPGPNDVYLLLEVSDSTLLLDRQDKLPVYARAGIPEVWIVNLPERLIEAYSVPVNGAYSHCRKVSAGETVAPAAFPDAVIDPALLFGTAGR